MKKKNFIKKIMINIILILIVLMHYPCYSSSVDNELLQSQMQSLNISDFTDEANKYTKEAFPEIDAQDLLSSAIKGEVDNKSLFEKVLNFFAEEFVDNLKAMRNYFGSCCYI